MRALPWLLTVRGRVAIAVTLAAAWLLYMLVYAIPDGQEAPPRTPLGSSGNGRTLGVWVAWSAGAFIFGFFALSLLAAIKLARNDSTHFRSLPPEEKARRHEAGELLKRSGTD
jgi:hypothetical protein